MTAANSACASSDLTDHLRLFRKYPPAQTKLLELSRLLGPTRGLSCLDVTWDDGMISHHLRKLGGSWQSAVADTGMVESYRAAVGDCVHPFDGRSLPFDDKMFDVVVVVDALERVASDSDFIAECHRVLKPAGRFVVNVSHLKTWTLLSAAERMLGMSAERIGWARAGYTESDLFRVLKDGFDVHQMRSYVRFWSRMIDVFLQFMLRRMKLGRFEASRRAIRMYGIAKLFFLVAEQIDMFLFFTRGFYLVAVGQRRAWRPRRAPVLADGRSITEAVLSKVGD